MSTTSENNSKSSSEFGQFIPLCEPSLQGKEWEYVRECLDSGWVSSVGSFVTRFETETARYVGAKHAVATINGTSALHVALLVAGVQPDDEVLVSTLTFIATANAVRYIGAHPVLIDAEPQYWQMNPDLVEEFLEKHCIWQHGELRNKVTGRRVKAIVPVHILGHPVQIDAIMQMAKKFNLMVVEDAAESLGASFQGRKIGSDADLVCFSFNGNKTITSGAGGMVVTNDQQLADRVRYLTTQAKDDPVEYIHHEVGYNYRMSNVLAALGLAQLEQLDQMVLKKRSIAANYEARLRNPGLTWFWEATDVYSTFWLSTALIDPRITGISATEMRKTLQDRGIQTRRLWRPVHTNPPYANEYSLLTGVADRITEHALSFPSSTSLTDEAQNYVCAVASGLTLPGQQSTLRRAA